VIIGPTGKRGATEYAMKPTIGIVLAFVLDFACQGFGIPSHAPALIPVALFMMAMTMVYIEVDRWALSPAKHTHDCRRAIGLTASQTLYKRPVALSDAPTRLVSRWN
jgi:hypothetical protein